MPLLSKEFLSEDTMIGVWNITEPIDFFYSNVVFNEQDSLLYNSFNNDSRKIQWLSVRVLMKSILGIQGRINICYDKNTKPFFPDNSFKVSISHSKNFSAVLLSKKFSTGIDIECINHRIVSIAHKFLSASELEFTNDINKIETLHVCWGAKEALYKMISNPEVNFISNFKIQPFAYDNNGHISVLYNHKKISKTYNLTYKKIHDYILVFVIDK